MDKSFRRSLLSALVVALSFFPAHSSAFPDKPVRMVLGQPPAGAVDGVTRLIADRLAPALGQAVVVENRPGASGIIAAEAVAKAAPDGHTLLVGTGGTHGTNSSVFRKLPYDPVKDFVPVSLLVRTPFALVVNPGFPAKSAAELVALARAQPGKINYASYGVGTANHLPMELFKQMAGIDLVHIPYKGAASAQLALIANDAQVMFDGIGSSAAHLKSGKLKLIGIGSPSRTPLAPGTPTISESGVPGFEASAWFGLFAPAGTPRAAVATLHRESVKVLQQPEVRARLTGLAYEVVAGSPEELADEVSREIAKWQRLVRERGLKFD